jgi:rubrerythrin
MTPLPEPQRPSAVEELAADPASRRRFLKAAGGAGVATSFALFLAACGSKQVKTTLGGSNPNTAAGTGTDRYGKGDLGIAIYALTLEYLESTFYAQAAASGKLTGRAATLVKTFGAQEAEHVKTLEAVVQKLGGKLPAKPKTNFQMTSQSVILSTASSLEYVGAGAYLGQADRISDKSLLAAALSIHSVEGRHDAAINALLGKDISPDGAFAKPQFVIDVIQATQPYITQ